MTGYTVGLVVARSGLSAHQARELGNLVRTWTTYAGVVRLHVWGGVLDELWGYISKGSVLGYITPHDGKPTADTLAIYDEVYCFPARSRTNCAPDTPVMMYRALTAMNYTHARVISAWSSEFRRPH